LVVLGQGPELEVLKELATQLGVADRTIFAGFQANPFPIVANADAYVLPSNGEGFPNSLVEAMCLGVPVISTNCQTGPSEILEDVADLDVKRVHRARFGILVPINEVAAMADAIRLATAAENQPRLANQAIAGASRYGLERTIAAYWSEATSV
jgi:N-acetylgalactosamine-N,N'-diacetylbacillosaminyl-diphospho-undecaprenol 4-alpha-N-acetylgalactosaminyltransferase